ncbi:MAG TPA: DUF5317 domain-containing protein [Candidatus Limnocylindrales bacterium]|jgi:hypothetical protein
MFILYALVAGLVIGLVTGGRLGGLAKLEFRWGGLIALGFLAQVLLFSDAVASRVGDLGPVLYVASTLLVVVAVMRNARIPGVPLVLAGALSNMTAIVANGGYMPATPEALASLGKSAPTIYSNSAVVPDPNLPLLIDRFALPHWLPFANVFSLGDVLLAIGVAVLIVTAMHRGRPGRQPAEPASLPEAA